MRPKPLLQRVAGMTSHAAVVARGMGRPCVCGAGALRINADTGEVSVAGVTLKRGDVVTVDGATGDVFVGEVKMVEPDLSGDFADLMTWADKARTLSVRTNAETPKDVATAKSFGAEGIGLCRTEHMFFDADRIPVVRAMILSENEKGRREALDKLLPMQREDFAEIFRIMEGRPCNIRLLDPPLHEFLPHSDEEIAEVARGTGISVEALRRVHLSYTRATRCWVTVDVVWELVSRRSTRCRRGRSSRLLLRSPRKRRSTIT